MKSYGSTLLRPGTGLNDADPSIGAQETSAMASASRRLSASDRRVSRYIWPTSRHSSVTPSKGTGVPAGVGRGGAAPRLGFAAGAGPLFRFRKSNGPLFLGLAPVCPDRFD